MVFQSIPLYLKIIFFLGVGNDMDDILVLGATNLPWDLDNAIIRRYNYNIKYYLFN